MNIGRVIEAHRTNYTVHMGGKELTATVRGNFHTEKDFPKVGDYVSLEILEDEKAVIESVEDRRSVIKRKAADSDEEQVIVANVDLLFIVMGLDADFSLNRLERYLLLAEQSNIPPVVILNKTDLVDDVDGYQEQIEQIIGDVPSLMVSAISGDNMEKFSAYITPDTTAVLLGSSGAGKSTITNWLLDENRQAVRETRDTDSRGRHTTTSRQLFALPSGGFIIDTPGMRELGLVETDADDVSIVFNKIDELAQNCKFRNCDHEKSDGCAILEAVASGQIEQRELDNYHKLSREQDFQDSKDSPVASRHQAQNQKRLSQKHALIHKQKLSRRLK